MSRGWCDDKQSGILTHAVEIECAELVSCNRYKQTNRQIEEEEELFIHEQNQKNSLDSFEKNCWNYQLIRNIVNIASIPITILSPQTRLHTNPHSHTYNESV